MADTIELRGLRLTALVGVLAEEQVRAQPIEVDVVLQVDLAPAGRSDDLVDTVDYGAVCDEVARVATAGHVALLETLADRMARAALDDSRVQRAEVAVRKLRPPVPHDLASSGVRVVRER